MDTVAEDSRIDTLSQDAAMEKFKAQLQFCKREKERFKQRNCLDSCMFYTSKLQELKWQMLQLKEQYIATGTVAGLKWESVCVPVAADNEDLQEDQLQLHIPQISFHKDSESKKLYSLRYVVCLPLQRNVLQEQKSELFRTCDLEKAQSKLIFNYPRSDLRIQESIVRGYLTVELYVERKLKGPSLIGAQRVSLQPLLTDPSIKGTLTFGEKQNWDITYDLAIRRPQNVEERDNFTMVHQTWLSLFQDTSSRVTRRVSIGVMRPGHRSKKNNHNSRRHSRAALLPTSEEKHPMISTLSVSRKTSDQSLPEVEIITTPITTTTPITSTPISTNQNKNTCTATKIVNSLTKRMSGFF